MISLNKIWKLLCAYVSKGNMTSDEVYLGKAVDFCDFAYREKVVNFSLGQNSPWRR